MFIYTSCIRRFNRNRRFSFRSDEGERNSVCDRVPVLFWKVDGKTVEGMAYLMNYGSISQPSMAYYSGIMKGYKQNNMDVSYLETAMKNSYSHFFSDEYESLDVHENTEEDEDFDEAFYAEDNPFQLKF